MFNKLYKFWRIAATGFSFAVFGVGAFLIALVLLLIVYPIPINPDFKLRLTRKTVWAATWLYVRMMWCLGLLSFEFDEMERLQATGQLIVANHPSLLDVVFMLSVMPNTNCIVKAALWKNPFTFGLVSLAGYIPNDDGGEELIEKAAETIKQGQRLIVFPEGTRTQPGKDRRFKRGAANIAIKAECKIQPVLISCEPKTLQKHEKWYEVPNTPPHFHLRALPAFDIGDCIDTSKPVSIQARHLSSYMVQYYDRELSHFEAAGSQPAPR